MSNKKYETIELKPISNIIRVRWGGYVVHFDVKNKISFQFECYPVTDWENIRTGEKGFGYENYDDGFGLTDYFDKTKCLKKLEGTLCHRGLWEGRLYFTDNEYWGDEIKELSELYNDYIIPWCKNFNKQENKHE